MDKGPVFRFTSTAFRVQPGEDDRTKSGVFGKALAEWVAAQLTNRGIATSGILPKDLGWCVAIVSDKPKLYVVCSSGDGENSWKVFAFAERRFFQNIDTGTPLGAVYRKLKTVFSENPDIKDLRMEEE